MHVKTARVTQGMVAMRQRVHVQSVKKVRINLVRVIVLVQHVLRGIIAPVVRIELRVRPMQPVPQVQTQSATVSARRGIQVMHQPAVVHVRRANVDITKAVQVIHHVPRRRRVTMPLVLGIPVRPRQLQATMPPQVRAARVRAQI